MVIFKHKAWLAAFLTEILIEILQSSASAVKKRCCQDYSRIMYLKTRQCLKIHQESEEFVRNSDRMFGYKSSQLHPYLMQESV